MSVRTIVVIMLALVCGLGAAVGIRQLRGGGATVVAPDVVTVVVAKADIRRGQMLTTKELETRDWPKGLVHATALTKIEDCVDRATVAAIVAGEPVLEGKLMMKGAGRGLAALVPVGMRAYTIQTAQDASNVAGFLLPGNRVDVLLNLRGGGAQDDTGGGSTVTLLQSVEILAVAQELVAPAENKMDPREMRSVTLLVAPDQAVLLDLGHNMGKLTLSLRNPEDTVGAMPTPATLNMLRHKQMGPVDPANKMLISSDHQDEPEQRYFKIRTIRGRHVGGVLVSSSNQASGRNTGTRSVSEDDVAVRAIPR